MYTKTPSEAVEEALRKAGKKQQDLIEIVNVGTRQAANKKVKMNAWAAADLIAVTAATGGKLIFEMPNGEQYELK